MSRQGAKDGHGGSCSDLLRLHADLLHAVLAFLDPESLASLAACNRRCQAITCHNDSLWRQLCTSRWAHVNMQLVLQQEQQPVAGAGQLEGTSHAAPVQQQQQQQETEATQHHNSSSSSLPAPASSPAAALAPPSSTWYRLYSHGNGWEQPHFSAAKVEPFQDYVSAVALLGPGTVLLATGEGLQARRCRLQPCEEDGVGGHRAPAHAATTLVAQCSVEPNHVTVHALDALEACPEDRATLIGGTSNGAVMLWRLDAAEGQLQHVRTSFHERGLGRNAPVVDVQVLRPRPWALALHDTTYSGLGAGRNRVRIYDLEADVSIADLVDPFESYELMCACSLGDSGNELVLGSVHGAFCRKCFAAGVPSLCAHKAQSALASFSTVDLRAPQQITQRFSMHHSSLFPLMASCRSTYLFTSHADQPLCVWDRRNMSCPLFEQERLRYFRAAYGPRQPARSPACGPAPGLGNPASPSAQQLAHTTIDRLWSSSRSRSPELWPGPHAGASPGIALTGTAGSSGIASSTGGVGSNGIAECGGGRSKEGGSAVAERQGREGGAWEQHAKAARWSGQSSQLFEGAWVEGDESNSEEEDEDEGEEEEQGAGWGLEGVEGEGNDEGGNEEGEVQEEQGRGGAWREEEREELLTFPLGSFCVRGVETHSMWLVCNDDVLLGRSDNGLLWKWDLSHTLGWARPPASQSLSGSQPGSPSLSTLATLSPAADRASHQEDTYGQSRYVSPPGSWHSAADALCHTNLWGGLARYEHWPMPLGCLPCETSLPCTYLARGWDPTGVALLVADAVDKQEAVVVAQLRL